MGNYSAQGSLTIKRLRNGDTFFITLEQENNIPLYQGVDDTTGAVSPSWSVAANQPIISPHITSARGNTVTIVPNSHKWKYNGTELTFGTEVSGWKTETNNRFKLETATGKIKIIANLASSSNVSNDTLEYSCKVKVGGVEYDMVKSIDILIQKVGANGYTGFITCAAEQLSSARPTTQLNTKLMCGAQAITNYTLKWYKDDTLMDGKTDKSLTVSRNDVNGVQVFIAEFIVNGAPVYRAGISVIDTEDDYQIQLAITSTNKEVSPNNNVTVTASIVNTTTNTVITPTSPSWNVMLMKKKNWTKIRSVSTPSITVSTSDTDDATTGEADDVEVVAEVSFS